MRKRSKVNLLGLSHLSHTFRHRSCCSVSAFLAQGLRQSSFGMCHVQSFRTSQILALHLWWLSSALITPCFRAVSMQANKPLDSFPSSGIPAALSFSKRSSCFKSCLVISTSRSACMAVLRRGKMAINIPLNPHLFLHLALGFRRTMLPAESFLTALLDSEGVGR